MAAEAYCFVGTVGLSAKPFIIFRRRIRPCPRPGEPSSLKQGPYRALIDTGASHSWVKPQIGDFLQTHSLEGYVIDLGDGEEEGIHLGFEVRLPEISMRLPI